MRKKIEEQTSKMKLEGNDGLLRIDSALTACGEHATLIRDIDDLLGCFLAFIFSELEAMDIELLRPSAVNLTGW